MPTYRTNGAWGSGIGVNLTPAQVDGNFYELRTDLDDVIANPPVVDDITSVSQSGFSFTFHKLSGATLGPLTVVPVYTVWRGDWQPFTLYQAANQFRVAGLGIFAVLQDHTSAATFDPDEVGGSPPAALYLMLIAVDPFAETVTTQTGSGSPAVYDLVLADKNSYIRCDNAGGLTVVIPAEADVAFEIGSTVAFEQTGAGSVLVTADGGVTLNCVATLTPETNGQFAVAQIKKVAADEWTIFGNLVLA